MTAPASTLPSAGMSRAAAKRKLHAAILVVEDTDATVAQLRKAHTMAAGATIALEQHLIARAAVDAESQRRSAAALARSMRDSRGRRRAPVTMPGYHKGRIPASKGVTYQKTPPTVNETLRMLSLAPTMRLVERGECPTCHAAWRTPHLQECVNPYGERFKALIDLLWRCGLRISCEALRLTEHDLFPAEGYLYVRRGKNKKPREVFVDDWVWPLLDPWLTFRQQLPPGPLFCAIEGPNAGLHPWSAPNIRTNLHALAKRAGIRHRVAPHQWRHAMTVEQYEEGVDILVISRNLGHSSLAVTNTYLEGFPQSRVIAELRARPVPKVSMFDMLRSEGLAVSDRPQARTAPDLMGALGSARPAQLVPGAPIGTRNGTRGRSDTPSSPPQPLGSTA